MIVQIVLPSLCTTAHRTLLALVELILSNRRLDLIDSRIASPLEKPFRPLHPVRISFALGTTRIVSSVGFISAPITPKVRGDLSDRA